VIAGTDQQPLDNLQKGKLCDKSECLSSKRWGTFSAPAVITNCISPSWYLEKMKNKLFTVLGFVLNGTP
jgi:hypothetical protein